MVKILNSLKSLLIRIRKYIVQSFRKVVEVCTLTTGHWRWIGYGILIIMGLILLGLWFDFAGVLHAGIYLAALGFLLGLPLLAGLGVRLGLKILKLLPERFSWLYFGGVFFVFFLFGLPMKAMIVLIVLLLFTGAFLGAGLYNLFGGRWYRLTKTRKILTLIFLVLGTGFFATGWWYLLYPGKAPEEVKIWALETEHKPDHLTVPDPSEVGPYEIDSLSYGWGKDKRRPEYAEGVTIVTPTVDGSELLDGWEKLTGKLRTKYWKMTPDSLALNGRVWYPKGQGSYPLVLMVHGNHLDRDFSDPGYGYLGRHFATHGIIAVSVDENFLNGAWSDFSKGLKTENDCRGWLLLKHLEQWREWNQCDTSLFFNSVNMDRVVLIGHSRGGEAVSIASCFNGLPFYPDNADLDFDFGFGIRGVAAIAPVDGQYWPGGIATPVQDVNYFTIQGSMDADLRSYDGLRQMRRVKFNDSIYHFASGLYVHGANHGQFNQSWGLFDAGYPHKLFLNRRAIIPVEQQEQVALVYLTAFVQESLYPGSGYLPLFRDYRAGMNWLPELVFLNQFHESSATILCEFEEDIDLTTGTSSIDSICGDELALWKEGRIPKKWGDHRNNGVFLGWNNKEDSIPGFYRIVLDSAVATQMEGARYLTFLAADAQTEPGERKDTTTVDEQSNNENINGNAPDNSEDDSEKEKDQKNKKDDMDEDQEKESDEDPIPVDFAIILANTEGVEYSVRVGEYQKLQPPIKPQVFKSRLFWEDPESEVILQYVTIPLDAFHDKEGTDITASEIRSICFRFDHEKNGTVILDQIGFAY